MSLVIFSIIECGEEDLISFISLLIIYQFFKKKIFLYLRVSSHILKSQSMRMVMRLKFVRKRARMVAYTDLLGKSGVLIINSN